MVAASCQKMVISPIKVSVLHGYWRADVSTYQLLSNRYVHMYDI